MNNMTPHELVYGHEYSTLREPGEYRCYLCKRDGKDVEEEPRVIDVVLAILRELKRGNDIEKPSLAKAVLGCPPHNMQPYNYTGAWGASTPRPTQRCTKCLLTA